MQVLKTLEEIINLKGNELLEDEWEIILNMSEIFITQQKNSTNYADLVPVFQRFFVSVRNLYISGEFNKTGIQNLMNFYDKIKYVINDTYFDAIYINWLKNQDQKFSLAKMNEILSFTGLLMQKDDNLSANFQIVDNRIFEILNSFENYYLSTEFSLIYKEELEKLFMEKAYEYQILGSKLNIDSRLKIIKILQIIGQNTRLIDNFAKILDLIVKIIQIGPSKSSFLSKQKTGSFITINYNQNVANFAHQVLLGFFKENYQTYPATKLILILKAMLKILKCEYREIIILTLKFFGNFTFDHDYYFMLTPWNIPSYFCGNLCDEYKFSCQLIFDAVMNFLNFDYGLDLLMPALNVILAICKSHYGLYTLDLPMDVKILIEFLESAITKKEIDASLKIVEILQIILTQRSPSVISGKNNGIKLAFAEIISIFEAYLSELGKIPSLFKPYLEEFRKQKTYKDFQAAPQKSYSEIPLFSKLAVKKLVQLSKILMNNIDSALYIYKEELLFAINELVSSIKIFLSDSLLAERFAVDLQEIFANIYYSGFIHKLTADCVLAIIELALQIGWRDIYFLSDFTIPTLYDYLCHKHLYNLHSLFGRNNDTAEPTPGEKNAANFFGMLTYPLGDSGHKIVEDLENKHKNKNKPKDVNWTHFGYQKDSNLAMHLATENIIHFYSNLTAELQKEILPYISRILSLEIKNEQSPIIQQTIILSELLSWINTTNFERVISDSTENNGPILEKSKIYILNDSVIQINSEKENINLILRNATSKIQAQIKLNNIRSKSIIKNEDNLKILTRIHESSTLEPQARIENEIILDPDFCISLLPGTLQNHFNEKIGAWENFEISSEIKGLIMTLDQIFVHNVHSIGILYIPKDCDMSLKSIFMPQNVSQRFTSFLSNLGTLVNASNCSSDIYTGGLQKDNKNENGLGIIYRDEISQAFFHVNSLMKIVNSEKTKEKDEEIYEKVRNYLSNDNVVIVWNESDKNLPSELFENSSTGIYILIDPLPTNFCILKVMNIFDLRKIRTTHKDSYAKIYGSMSEYLITNDIYLPKIIIRSAISSDIKAQRTGKGKEKNQFISELLKRCSIIKEIKKKCWLDGGRKFVK